MSRLVQIDELSALNPEQQGFACFARSRPGLDQGIEEQCGIDTIEKNSYRPGRPPGSDEEGGGEIEMGHRGFSGGMKIRKKRFLRPGRICHQFFCMHTDRPGALADAEQNRSCLVDQEDAPVAVHVAERLHPRQDVLLQVQAFRM